MRVVFDLTQEAAVTLWHHMKHDKTPSLEWLGLSCSTSVAGCACVDCSRLFRTSGGNIPHHIDSCPSSAAEHHTAWWGLLWDWFTTSVWLVWGSKFLECQKCFCLPVGINIERGWGQGSWEDMQVSLPQRNLSGLQRGEKAEDNATCRRILVLQPQKVWQIRWL